jgi:outer membrane protein assembly factor BamE (lipoprotein component of BamABCDE complex)
MAAPNLPVFTSFHQTGRSYGRVLLIRAAAAGGMALTLAGCIGYDGVLNRGAVIDQRKAAQIKAGMAAPQVLSILGTPSTTSTVGGDAWYYFSQRTERPVAFMPQKVTDQHVLGVYFDKSKKVQRIADYGMEDGKTIDFNSRQTATTGAETNIVQGLFTKLIPF